MDIEALISTTLATMLSLWILAYLVHMAGLARVITTAMGAVCGIVLIVYKVIG
jgi:hypothetical protein